MSDLTPEAPARLPVAGVLVAALLIAVIVLAGEAMAWAARPAPGGAFARCHTAPQVAPNVFKAAPPMCIDPKAVYNAKITTTKGDITLVLLASSAPVTVNNWITLAVNGYYDGMSFFKVADFYTQTGDPRGDGTGGPGYLLPDEGDQHFVPGSLGMARMPLGVSGSQFFITRSDWPGGQPTTVYNHFATVSLGVDVVGQLSTSDRVLRILVRKG
ncbi:MAG TPA: peptidylprolyl isomerase [Candidatus Dormibacteraeota bacterium]